MLVQFDSKAGRIVMFGGVATELLHRMGHSGTIPSALLAEDVPEALARLRSAVSEADTAAPGDAAPPEDEHPVSLRQRALPLIELLERAAERGCDVVWDAA
jgi:hypothetical protein